jgi:hypothetical protein
MEAFSASEVGKGVESKAICPVLALKVTAEVMRTAVMAVGILFL